MGKLWRCVIVGMLICLLGGTMTFAATLDTQGTACPAMTCHVNTVKVQSITPAKIVYEFTGVCGIWNPPPETACPPPANVTVTAEWLGGTKQAHEKIFKPIANTSSVILYSETTSSCPENPWLKAGVACTVTSGNTKPGEKYPRSAALLSSDQRQSLASQQPPGTTILPTPTVPEIQSPYQNQKYGFLPATVKIAVKHNPNYGVAFEFQWKPFSKPNTPPGFFVTKKLTPTNQKTSAGITTADAKIETAGYWRIRSQSIFPGAPWSDWRNFTVDQLTLKLQHSIQLAPPPGK